MPLTWVLVRVPAGQAPNQSVFVNRKFRRPAGITETPFQVEIGTNTFSLRSGNALTAESVADCPDSLQTAPFVIDLMPIALAMAIGAPAVSGPQRAARKKSAKKAPKRKAAGKKKASRKKTSKKAPKKTVRKKTAPKKTAKRKTGRKKSARKTTRRRGR